MGAIMAITMDCCLEVLGRRRSHRTKAVQEQPAATDAERSSNDSARPPWHCLLSDAVFCHCRCHADSMKSPHRAPHLQHPIAPGVREHHPRGRGCGPPQRRAGRALPRQRDAHHRERLHQRRRTRAAPRLRRLARGARPARPDEPVPPQPTPARTTATPTSSGRSWAARSSSLSPRDASTSARGSRSSTASSTAAAEARAREDDRGVARPQILAHRRRSPRSRLDPCRQARLDCAGTKAPAARSTTGSEGSRRRPLAPRSRAIATSVRKAARATPVPPIARRATAPERSPSPPFECSRPSKLEFTCLIAASSKAGSRRCRADRREFRIGIVPDRFDVRDPDSIGVDPRRLRRRTKAAAADQGRDHRVVQPVEVAASGLGFAIALVLVAAQNASGDRSIATTRASGSRSKMRSRCIR